MLKGRELLDSLRPQSVETDLAGVRLWQMSAAKVVALEEQGELKGTAAAVALLRECLGDESGPFHPPYDPSGLPAPVIRKLMRAAQKFNKLSEESQRDVRGN